MKPTIKKPAVKHVAKQATKVTSKAMSPDAQYQAQDDLQTLKRAQAIQSPKISQPGIVTVGGEKEIVIEEFHFECKFTDNVLPAIAAMYWAIEKLQEKIAILGSKK